MEPESEKFVKRRAQKVQPALMWKEKKRGLKRCDKSLDCDVIAVIETVGSLSLQQWLTLG